MGSGESTCLSVLPAWPFFGLCRSEDGGLLLLRLLDSYAASFFLSRAISISIPLTARSSASSGAAGIMTDAPDSASFSSSSTSATSDGTSHPKHHNFHKYRRKFTFLYLLTPEWIRCRWKQLRRPILWNYVRSDVRVRLRWGPRHAVLGKVHAGAIPVHPGPLFVVPGVSYGAACGNRQHLNRLHPRLRPLHEATLRDQFS